MWARPKQRPLCRDGSPSEPSRNRCRARPRERPRGSEAASPGPSAAHRSGSGNQARTPPSFYCAVRAHWLPERCSRRRPPAAGSPVHPRLLYLHRRDRTAAAGPEAQSTRRRPLAAAHQGGTYDDARSPVALGTFAACGAGLPATAPPPGGN